MWLGMRSDLLNILNSENDLSTVNNESLNDKYVVNNSATITFNRGNETLWFSQTS